MRLTKIVFSLILFIGILAGCATDDDTAKNGTEPIEVDIIISLENGEEILEEATIEVESGSVLLDVLEENFDVKIADGGYVEAINDIQAEDGQTYSWMYTVNGEHSMVGAGDYVVENGDLIEFDFHSWE